MRVADLGKLNSKGEHLNETYERNFRIDCRAGGGIVAFGRVWRMDFFRRHGGLGTGPHCGVLDCPRKGAKSPVQALEGDAGLSALVRVKWRRFKTP